jgi:hypothetical protein
MRRILDIHICNDAILQWATIKFSLVYDNDSPIWQGRIYMGEQRREVSPERAT